MPDTANDRGRRQSSRETGGELVPPYDDPTIMNEKARYVRKENLGGIMFWELSGDTSNGTLITAVRNG